MMDLSLRNSSEKVRKSISELLALKSDYSPQELSLILESDLLK